ncbi:hypothetical protein BJ546DRAFT_585628 [Cryomyces antarcticus]
MAQKKGATPKKGRTSKVTVEFRQHVGTLDVVETICWVELTTGLVEWAHDVSQGEWWRLIICKYNDLDFTTDDLLAPVGASTFVGDVMGRRLDPQTVLDRFASTVKREEQALSQSWKLCEKETSSWTPRSGQSAAFEKYTRATVLYDLVVGNARRTLQASGRDAIDDTIRKKFWVGGYGEFPSCISLHICDKDGKIYVRPPIESYGRCGQSRRLSPHACDSDADKFELVHYVEQEGFSFVVSVPRIHFWGRESSYRTILCVCGYRCLRLGAPRVIRQI